MTVKGGINGGLKNMGDRINEANSVIDMVKLADSRSEGKYVIG